MRQARPWTGGGLRNGLPLAVSAPVMSGDLVGLKSGSAAQGGGDGVHEQAEYRRLEERRRRARAHSSQE